MRIFLISVVFAFLHSSCFSSKSEVPESSEPVKEAESKAIKIAPADFAKLKTKTVTVVDPNESTPKKAAKIKFEGYEGLAVLDQVFGDRKNWSERKELTFVCADGYKPALETKYFLKGGYYFATKRVGKKDFTIVNNAKDQKMVELGPLYLVWTTPAMQKKDKGHFWPYQLVAIE